MRLIDADALQERAICGGNPDGGFIPIKRLLEAPTIEPPVVRCSACKWHDRIKGQDHGYCLHRGVTPIDGFCYKGEIGKWEDRHKTKPKSQALGNLEDGKEGR